MELLDCHNLAVPKEVMHHVVRVESSYNPYAIGVVGGRLVRQPRSLPEALATVHMLESRGYNFSLGLAQVNRYNLEKFGLGSYEAAFEACPNVQAGARILAECYGRSGGDWGKSLSCYYSGNPVTGFRHGYVQKVFASMRASGLRVGLGMAGSPDTAGGKGRRRVVEVDSYPLHAPRASGKQDRHEMAGLPSRAPRLAPIRLAAAGTGAIAQPELPPPTPLSLTKAVEAEGREGAANADQAFVF